MMKINLTSNNLGQQLLTKFGISLLTVGLTTLGVNYYLINLSLKQQIANRALSIAQSIEFATEGLIEAQNMSALRRVVQNYGTLPAIEEIAIIKPDGVVLAHSSQQNLINLKYVSRHPELANPMQKASTTGQTYTLEIKSNQTNDLVQILPFSSALFKGANRRGLSIVIIDLEQMEEEAWESFVTSTITMLIGTIIILIMMGLLIQKLVLKPLSSLDKAVASSKTTGVFILPTDLVTKEINFLAKTFDTVFKQLVGYEQLKAETQQRIAMESALRDSEAREREKSERLAQLLEDLKRSQAQIIQTEKMSSLGQMVGGIAHEINNPVGFIHTNVAYAEQYLQGLINLLNAYEKNYPTPPPEIQEIKANIDWEFIIEDLPNILGSMKSGTERIKAIVLSLRNFSRLDESAIKLVDIHEGIENTLMLVQHKLGSRIYNKSRQGYAIKLIKNYGQLPLVECYASELNQVFLNLLNNAIESLESSYKESNTTAIPTIEITTEFAENDKTISLKIKDNGSGIKDEVVSRIFDPFFTTKPIGKGTGLGLSIAYQIIVEKHGGKLQCFSDLGKGAEFVITIPIKAK